MIFFFFFFCLAEASSLDFRAQEKTMEEKIQNFGRDEVTFLSN